MKTRRTRSSNGADPGDEGDPGLIGFRRSRKSTNGPSSSNASGASDGGSKKKSPTSQPFSRLSSDPVEKLDSNGKLTAASAAAAPRRATRTSTNSASGSPNEHEHTVGVAATEREIETNLKQRQSAYSKRLKSDQEKDSVVGKGNWSALHNVNDNSPHGRRNKYEGDEEENDYDACQHPPPPVKEITTTTTTGHHSITEMTKNRRGDGPKYLEDNTMKLVYDSLDGYKGDFLDEDDVVAFMSRMQKTANEQAKYQMQLVSGPSTRQHPESDRDSDYNSDDTSVFNDCLREEEEHAIGHDMFKKVVSNIQLDYSRKSSGGSRTASFTNANKLLDKKTLGWIKRAAGLHRNDPGKMLMQKSGEGKGGRMSTRRYTRKQALDRRGQKKKERALDVLGAALTQLEAHYGPFPVRKIKRKLKKKRRPDEDKTTTDRKRKKEDATLEEINRKKKKPSNDNVRWCFEFLDRWYFLGYFYVR